MPTYKVTDPTGRTVRLTGDSPPSEKEIMQVFESLGASVTPEVTQPSEPTFGENVGTALYKRYEAIKGLPAELSRPQDAARLLLRTGGEIAGGVGDIVGEAGKSLYKTVVPEDTQASIATGVKGFVQPQSGKRNLMEDVSNIPMGLESFYPGASKDVGAFANIGMLYPGGLLAKKGVSAGAEGINIGRDLASLAVRKTPEVIDKEIAGVVKKNIGKTVRIAPQGKPTWRAIEGYFDKSGVAVQDIIKNKESLELTNIVGDVVKNQLPETRLQALQAAHDTKSRIFNEFNAKQVAAGKAGAVIDLKSLAKELDPVINNKTLLADADGRAIIAHAKLQQEYLREAASFTPEQAQEWITRANSKLSPAYAKGSYQDVSRAGVDESIASMMRKQLDSAIERAGEKGYQDLKNRYGAQVQFEKGMTKASVAALSKASMPNFFDITSGTALVHGLLSMNPATVTAAGFMEAMNIARRHFQNPDTYVKNMFTKTEKLMQQRGVTNTQFQPKSELFK